MTLEVEVGVVEVAPEVELLVLVLGDPVDVEIGELARRGAVRARRIAAERVQVLEVIIPFVEALEYAPLRLEITAAAVAGGRAGMISVVLQDLGEQAVFRQDRGRPVGEAGGDARGIAAGLDRRDRVARRRCVRPALLEHDRLRGERVEARGGRPRVAVGADVIGAQGVDGDHDDVQILRHRRRHRRVGHARRRRRGRLVAVAVLVDPVVGEVEGARVHVAIEVVAVAAAEHRRVAVAIEIGRGVDEPDQRAGGAGERDRRLAHAVGAADAERDQQEQPPAPRPR